MRCCSICVYVSRPIWQACTFFGRFWHAKMKTLSKLLKAHAAAWEKCRTVMSFFLAFYFCKDFDEGKNSYIRSKESEV